MKRFKNILFVVGSNVDGGMALERAVTLAGNNQAQLTVVEVMGELPSAMGTASDRVSPEMLQKAMREECRERLECLVEPIRKNIHVNTKVLVGKPFLAIIREVLQGQRDLVMTSVQDGGRLERIFGSNDMHLLRKCPCPVWLMKPTEAKSYRRILAAVDIGEADDIERQSLINRQVLEMATSLAHSEFCELHVVHVWRAYGESELRSGFARIPQAKLKAYLDEVYQKHLQWLNGLMDDLATWMGKEVLDYVKPQVHLLKGNAKEVIPRLADELQVDFIVMGTLARAGIPGFIMGNTAETILNRIDCSLLAVKPEGFVTPVKVED